MAVTATTLIADTLQLARQTDMSDAGAQTTGMGSGFASEVTDRFTEDFLFQKFLEFATLLHTPSPYNCLYLEGSAVGNLDVATASTAPGLIDLSTISPFVWRPKTALVNGYPLLPMSQATASLYCSMGASDVRGNPASFVMNGQYMQVLPVPPEPTGISTVRIEVRGAIVPTLPTLMEPAAEGGTLTSANSFSFLPDNELRHLLPRYGIVALSQLNQDDPDLGGRGAEAANQVHQWVLSRYNSLNIQVRNTVFQTAPTPPIPYPGTLKQRKQGEV